MPPSSLTADIERLQSSVNSLLALIKHCQSSLSLLTTPATPSTTSTAAPTAEPTSNTTTTTEVIPPLSLLHDTASLAKAHTTKLALLLTQSTLSSTCRATIPILSTLQQSVLPPLVTSLELLHTQHHGKSLIHAVTRPVTEILLGIEDMVGGPLKTMIDESLKRGVSGKEEPNKGEKENVILPSTGKIWGACDKLVGMKSKGLVGIVGDRIKSSEETIKDAVEELETYCKKHTPSTLTDSTTPPSSSSAGNSDGDEDDDDDDDDGDFWDDDDDDGEFPSSAQKKKRKPLPPHIITRITSSVKRLKTLLILFKAIQKRRLTSASAPSPDPAQTTSPKQQIVMRLDGFVDLADELVVLVDEIVGEYYEIDGGEEDTNDKTLSVNEKSLIQKAIALATLAQPTWDGSSTDTAIRLFEECAKAVQR